MSDPSHLACAEVVVAVAPEDAHVLAAPLCSPRSDSLEVSTPSSDEYLSLD